MLIRLFSWVCAIEQKLLRIFGTIFGFTVLTIFYYQLGPGAGWEGAFRPAVLLLLSGQNPYIQFNFFNPPWALLPIISFALLPIRIGSALISATNLCVFVYVLRRLGATKKATLLFLTIPFVFWTVNLDSLVALGLILPPQIGLFFLLIKPQVGAVVAVYIFFNVWRSRGWRAVLGVFTPIIIITLVSFVLFGLWPLRFLQQTRPEIRSSIYNLSVWPASLFIAIPLLIFAVIKGEKRIAIGASPLLSPYVLVHSWPIALMGLLPNHNLFAIGVLLLWLVDLFRTHICEYIFHLLFRI